MRAGLAAISVAVVLGLGVGYGAAAVADRSGTDEVHAVEQLRRPPQSTVTPSAGPTPSPEPTVTEPMVTEPIVSEPRVLWSYEDTGRDVRELEARLVQLGLMPARWVDAYFGTVTGDGVRAFQRRAGVPVTGDVDERTWELLRAGTRSPVRAELYPPRPVETRSPAALDERCLTGRALCIDKSTRELSWVVDGRVLRRLDVRFGSAYTPTREGVFTVYRKSADHVSSLYGSSMPYAMFFSRGQAVHYSSDFATQGYAGASHGCVNVRDRAALAALFEKVRVGDRVVVHRS